MSSDQPVEVRPNIRRFIIPVVMVAVLFAGIFGASISTGQPQPIPFVINESTQTCTILSGQQSALCTFTYNPALSRPPIPFPHTPTAFISTGIIYGQYNTTIPFFDGNFSMVNPSGAQMEVTNLTEFEAVGASYLPQIQMMVNFRSTPTGLCGNSGAVLQFQNQTVGQTTWANWGPAVPIDCNSSNGGWSPSLNGGFGSLSCNGALSIGAAFTCWNTVSTSSTFLKTFSQNMIFRLTETGVTGTMRLYDVDLSFVYDEAIICSDFSGTPTTETVQCYWSNGIPINIPRTATYVCDSISSNP